MRMVRRPGFEPGFRPAADTAATYGRGRAVSYHWTNGASDS